MIHVYRSVSYKIWSYHWKVTIEVVTFLSDRDLYLDIYAKIRPNPTAFTDSLVFGFSLSNMFGTVVIALLGCLSLGQAQIPSPIRTCSE